jgi:hypothetical protein
MTVFTAPNTAPRDFDHRTVDKHTLCQGMCRFFAAFRGAISKATQASDQDADGAAAIRGSLVKVDGWDWK